MKKNKLKRFIQYLINTISIFVLIIAVILLTSVIFTSKQEIPNVMGYSMLRLLTNSMEPSYPVDTLILVKKQDVDTIEVGDVISFYSNDPDLDGFVNTHRVVEVEKDNDDYIFHTKGDHNVIEDEYTVSGSRIIGVVINKSVFLGKVVRLVYNPLVYIPIIIAPLVIMILYHFIQIFKSTKELSNQQEEEYQKALKMILEKKKKNNNSD